MRRKSLVEMTAGVRAARTCLCETLSGPPAVKADRRQYYAVAELARIRRPAARYRAAMNFKARHRPVRART